MKIFARKKKPAARRQRKKRSSGRQGAGKRAFGWTLVTMAAVGLAGVGALKWSGTPGGQAVLLGWGVESRRPAVQAAVDDVLATALPGFGAGPSTSADGSGPAWDHATGPEGAVIRCRRVAVESDRPWWRVQAELAGRLRSVGARILWGERLATGRRPGDARTPDETTDLLRLDVGVTGYPTHTLLLHRAPGVPRVRWGGGDLPTAWSELSARQAPTIALVIDDCGYGRSETTRRILDLPVPLTLAVLPGLSYSRHFALQGTDLVLPAAAGGGGGGAARAARLAAGCPVEVSVAAARSGPQRRRREIMLHLPMQPQSWPETDPGPRAVMVGMDRDRIAGLVDEALVQLPGARGVNNHMGSAATGDPETMDDLMAVLGERGLYFVDSLTSAHSVAWTVAQEAGLPSLRNRIFLDYGDPSAETVRANLAVLVRSARQRGFAVGIGHPHALTVDVLAREVPRLVAAGVRFVTVSELLALQATAAGEG